MSYSQLRMNFLSSVGNRVVFFAISMYYSRLIKPIEILIHCFFSIWDLLQTLDFSITHTWLIVLRQHLLSPRINHGERIEQCTTSIPQI